MNVIYVDPILNHGDLASRLAHLRQLEREGVKTTQTQTEVVSAWEEYNRKERK